MRTKKFMIELFLFTFALLVTNTGFSQDTLTAWTYKISAPINAYPVVNDTILYFGGMDKTFYAIHTTKGTRLWSFKTPYVINSKALVEDGIVYFECGNRIYALDALTGDSLWSYVAKGDAPVISVYDTDYHHSSPFMNNNIVYFADGWSNVNGLDPKTGHLVFRYNTGTTSPIRSTPVIKDTVLYFGDWDSHIYAVSTIDCTLIWKKTLQGIEQYYGAIVSEFVIHDTLLYFGSQHLLYSPLDIRTGNPAWVFNDNKRTYMPSTPVFYGDSVIIGTTVNAFRIYSVYNGSLNWQFTTEGICFVKPVIKDTVLFMNTSNFGSSGHLYLIDVRNGKFINEIHIASASPTSPVISDDLLFIGDNSGNMRAFFYEKLLKTDTFAVSLDTSTLILPPQRNGFENFDSTVAILNESKYCDYYTVEIEIFGNPKTGGIICNNTNGHLNSKIVKQINYSIRPVKLDPGEYSIRVTLTSRRNPDKIYIKNIRFKIEENEKPVYLPIENIEENTGFGSITIDLSNHFEDPDSGNITYTVTSSNTDVVTVTVVGSILTIDEEGIGISTISLSAKDQLGARTYAQFDFEINTINSLNEKKEIRCSFYPNPTSGNITIENPTENVLPLSVKIINIDGKVVFEKQVTEASDELNIDFSDFTNGVYYLNLYGKDLIKSEKIVILK